MAGFKSISVEKGEESGTQKVTVVTDGSEEITQDDAVESLGPMAKRYVVHTWEKEEADS